MLTDGLIVCQKWVYAEKCKKEPTRCLKCQGWGHLSYACPQLYDTCGTCGDWHRTSACTNMNRLHCASCKTHTHASWDRMCLSFMCRCEEMDGRLPENLMPYFPTAEPWTHVSQQPKIATPTLTLPPPASLPNTGEWSMITQHSSTCQQATLPFKSAAQGQQGADQGMPASQ